MVAVETPLCGHPLARCPYQGYHRIRRCGWVTNLGAGLLQSQLDERETTVTAGDVAGLIRAIDTAEGNGVPDTICLEEGTYTLTAVDKGDSGNMVCR